MNKEQAFYESQTYKLYNTIRRDYGFSNDCIIKFGDYRSRLVSHYHVINGKYLGFTIEINEDDFYPEYALLHELGHAIDFYKISRKDFDKILNDSFLKLLCELKAWSNAIKLCVKYNIEVNKKQFQKDMINCMQSYINTELVMLDDQEIDTIRSNYYNLIKCLE